MEAVGLGCGVKAALCVNVELTVTLTPIHWCAIEGVFALGTLNGKEKQIQFEQRPQGHKLFPLSLKYCLINAKKEN